MFKLASFIISVLIAFVGGHYIGQVVEPFIASLALSVVFGLCCGIAGLYIGEALENRYGA